jgi:hypothetical protein
MIELARVQDDATVLLAAIYGAPTPHVQRELVEQLRPREGDYDRVFVESAVPSARLAYEALWAQSPTLRTGPAQKSLVVRAALAEDFGAPGSGRVTWFPGGYLKIASLLIPGIPWMCWKLIEETAREGGILYDGLTRIDDHWAWFPKPWRAIAKRAPVGARHWAE